MDPNIRYTRTSDGVNIAYWTLGQGPPLLYLFPVVSHLQLEWQIPTNRRLYERLAARFTLVRYDARNSGLSQHGVEYSLEGLVRDMEAVIDRIPVERCSLFASGVGGPPAIAFAQLHPERTERLVLWETYAAFSDLGAQVDALLGLLAHDYEMYAQALASVAMGWENNEDARAFAATIRGAMTPEEARALAEDLRPIDASARLPDVRCPTLIVHHRDAPLIPDAAIQRIATEIPDGRVVILQGSNVNIGLTNEEFGVVEAFLLEDAEVPPTAAAPTPLPSGTAIILFADIADSTALTERLGDAAFRERARALDDALRNAVRDNGGAVIDAKTLGDGILATFPAASQAVAAALACAAAGDECALPLHVGLHAGDIIRERDNVFGGAVNIAARISALAAPGEVLVSDIVRGLARTSAAVAFEDRGERELKGIADAQRVFAVSRND